MKKTSPALVFVLLAAIALLARDAWSGVAPALPVGRVPFAAGAIVEDGAYGPVGYWKSDAIPVPARPTRNILFNGSFEQGLAGWCLAWPSAVQVRRYGECIENGGRCYEETVADAKFGRKALHLRPLKPGTLRDNICSETIAVYTNRPYTASFWAKAGSGERAVLTFQVGTPVRRTDHGKGVAGEVSGIADGRPPRVKPVLDCEWRRFEVSFRSNVPGVWLMLSGEGAVVDGVMIEEGTKAGAPVDDPLVAHLVTASPDNNLTDADDRMAKVEVSRQFDGECAGGGSLRVRVLNYYYEPVVDRTFPLASAADESYPINLSHVGVGVFVVRYDFSLPGGRAWTDYERFGVL